MNIKLLSEIQKHENLIQHYLYEYRNNNIIRNIISEDFHYVLYRKPSWFMAIRDANEEGTFGFNNFSYQSFCNSKEACIRAFNQVQNENPTRKLALALHHQIATISHHLYNIGYFINKNKSKLDIILTIPVDRDDNLAEMKSWPSSAIQACLADKTYMKYLEFINWSETKNA